MKAADIPDHEPLMVVEAGCDYGYEFTDSRSDTWTHGGPGRSLGLTRWDIGQELWEYPESVLLRKLQRLVRRGLLDGCPCGCRGDFTITEAGRALLAG